MIPNDKVWLVEEENPRPDPYIVILVREKEFLEQPLTQAYRICHSVREAITYASVLKKKYQAKHIRLFYPNNVSIIVKQENQ